jgi:uncharacterized damage-inducible protein DinB
MNEKSAKNIAEPWLRGTLTDVPAVARAVLHALELADEDLRRWTETLTEEELNSHASGIAPVAFHLRHIARSLDRLLTYAEGRPLSADQIVLLKTEVEPGAKREQLFSELSSALKTGMARVQALADSDMSTPRQVGAKQLPTTVGGLLVHIADHTQRHVGQAITTAKVVAALRTS